MASGLLIKQKQLLAGDGIAINHGETASTISLAENALENAVRIYDATVEAETGVVTITDGTPVTDLRIGDEIRTPDGVYQKTKDSITTGSPADGTRIKVSGITSPAEANGLYILTETEKVWKHESADYWISQWSGSYWLIANTSSPSNPGMSIFYASGSSSSMPWEMSNWSAMSSSGSPVLENTSTEQIVTDTISLFEYASLADDVTRLGNAVNQAGGLLQIDLETNAIPEEYLDTTRLLPETPEDGDVPVYNATATTGGGNDKTVKLLIQPSTSENQIVDSAAGNVVPVSLSIEGDITVSEEGIMQFTQSQTISVPMAFSTVEMITGNSEWCLDFEFIPPTDLNDDNEFWSLYNDEQSYVGFWRGSMGDIVHMPCFGDIPGFTRGEKHLLTFEQWKDGETWKLSGYRNGSIGKTVETLIPAATSQDISFGHGNKRKFKGQIVSIRFRNVAPYRGTSFQPDATPYTVPQIVGEWKTTSAKELVSDAIDKSRLLPDPSTLSSNSEGNVVAVTKLAADVNTIRLMHFNADFSDSVTGDSPVSTTNVSLQGPGKFGKSLHFDGNPPSDFYYPALSSSPGKWTIDFWIYLTQYMNSQAALFVFGTVLNEADVAVLGVDNTGIRMEVGYHNSVISGGESVSLNEWHHIAVTYADNTYKCYLDGNLYASQSSEKKVYFTKNLWLGSYFAYNGDHTMRGMIDEFRISNIVRWDSNFTPPDKEYEGGMLSYAITDPDELVSVDAKIATHNTSLDAHPMHNTAEADFNNITESGFYNQYNQSSVNAPLNFDIGYFLIVSKYEDSTNTKLVQIALPRLEDAIQWIYTRYAVSDSADGALEWTKWSCTKGAAHYLTETDFNTVVDSGNYLISQGSAGSPNSPTNTTYLLNVTAYTEVGLARIFQTATKYATGTSVQEIYTRVGVRETAGGAVVWNDWLRLSNATTVISNPDYNQVTATGTYYMSTGSGSQNAPDQSSYMLTVLSYKETSWERIFQTAVRYVTNTQSDKQAIFTRVGDRTTAGGEITWTKWSAISSSESTGTTTNDYNTLTTPGDYYLSFGNNNSNVNAPSNGPFHVLVHRYQNAAGTAKPILQIAASQIVSEEQTPMMFFRSASYANSAWTFQPWLRLLTEKDIKYVTGSINTGIGEEKNDYIVIGNCVIYIGQFKKLLPASGNFYLPVSASNVTIMMGLAKTDSNATAPTSIACDCSGTTVTYNIDGELSSGYVYINWIGIGYLS